MVMIQIQNSPRKFSITTTKTQFLRKIRQIAAWFHLHMSPSSLLTSACRALPVSCFPIRSPVPRHFPLYCSVTTPALVVVIFAFPGFCITPRYVLTHEDLELGPSDEKECGISFSLSALLQSVYFSSFIHLAAKLKILFFLYN